MIFPGTLPLEDMQTNPSLIINKSDHMIKDQIRKKIMRRNSSSLVFQQNKSMNLKSRRKGSGEIVPNYRRRNLSFKKPPTLQMTKIEEIPQAQTRRHTELGLGQSLNCSAIIPLKVNFFIYRFIFVIV